MTKKKANFHDYISVQIKKGTAIEMEHTKDPKVAQTIALQHLRENSDYYKYTGKKGKEYLITKKKGDKIYVYKERDFLIKPDRVWTEDLKNPLKSHGATKYRKYALSSKRSTSRHKRDGRFGKVY
jgi:hypothetical protein